MKNILREICNAHSINLSLTDAKEALITIRDRDPDIAQDFYLEVDGMEFRIIHEDVLDDIHTEETEELVKDCYLGGTDLPWWLAIDWEQTAENIRQADGYGHHFATYDGEELYTDGWYIFRTN